MSRIPSDLVGIPFNKVLVAMPLAILDRPLTHLDSLESESIHIFREVAAEFARPALLFSGGKGVGTVTIDITGKAAHAGPFHPLGRHGRDSE